MQKLYVWLYLTYLVFLIFIHESQGFAEDKVNQSPTSQQWKRNHIHNHRHHNKCHPSCTETCLPFCKFECCKKELIGTQLEAEEHEMDQKQLAELTTIAEKVGPTLGILVKKDQRPTASQQQKFLAQQHTKAVSSLRKPATTAAATNGQQKIAQGSVNQQSGEQVGTQPMVQNVAKQENGKQAGTQPMVQKAAKQETVQQVEKLKQAPTIKSKPSVISTLAQLQKALGEYSEDPLSEEIGEVKEAEMKLDHDEDGPDMILLSQNIFGSSANTANSNWQPTDIKESKKATSPPQRYQSPSSLKQKQGARVAASSKPSHSVQHLRKQKKPTVNKGINTGKFQHQKTQSPSKNAISFGNFKQPTATGTKAILNQNYNGLLVKPTDSLLSHSSDSDIPDSKIENSSESGDEENALRSLLSEDDIEESGSGSQDTKKPGQYLGITGINSKDHSAIINLVLDSFTQKRNASNPPKISLKIPSEHVKNFTETGDKTIILAVPVKIDDKKLIQKQTNAIKEKLLEISDQQSSKEKQATDEKMEKPSQMVSESSGDQNLPDGKPVAEEEKGSNQLMSGKNGEFQTSGPTSSSATTSSAPQIPDLEANVSEEHLQEISSNPVTAVLDELKKSTKHIQKEVEKEDKGFGEILEKMKAVEAEKAKQNQALNAEGPTEGPQVMLDPSNEGEDNSNESLLPPEVNAHTAEPSKKPSFTAGSESHPTASNGNQGENKKKEDPNDTSHFTGEVFVPSKVPSSFHSHRHNRPSDKHIVAHSGCHPSCEKACTPACHFSCCKNASKKKAKEGKKSKGKGKHNRKEKAFKDGNDAADVIGQKLPHLPKIKGKINYSTGQGKKFLKEAQAKIETLINILEKSSATVANKMDDDNEAPKKRHHHNRRHHRRHHHTTDHVMANHKNGASGTQSRYESAHKVNEYIKHMNNSLCDTKCKIECVPSCRFECCKQNERM